MLLGICSRGPPVHPWKHNCWPKCVYSHLHRTVLNCTLLKAGVAESQESSHCSRRRPLLGIVRYLFAWGVLASDSLLRAQWHVTDYWSCWTACHFLSYLSVSLQAFCFPTHSSLLHSAWRFCRWKHRFFSLSVSCLLTVLIHTLLTCPPILFVISQNLLLVYGFILSSFAPAIFFSLDPVLFENRQLQVSSTLEVFPLLSTLIKSLNHSSLTQLQLSRKMQSLFSYSHISRHSCHIPLTWASRLSMHLSFHG